MDPIDEFIDIDLGTGHGTFGQYLAEVVTSRYVDDTVDRLLTSAATMTKRATRAGHRDGDADDHHLYITNLPREEFLPEDLATIYGCRWAVERLFRDLKMQYELNEFDTTKEHVVKILVYAALLSLLVDRELLTLLTECADDDIVFPTGRWAATFRSHAQLILNDLGKYLDNSPPPLLERLIEDGQKVHIQRPIL